MRQRTTFMPTMAMQIVSVAVLMLSWADSRLFAQDTAPWDWPNIRGPSWDGISHETGLIDQWPESGPPVLWTRELGQGYSAFVAWGDRIATQYQSLSGQFVVCLDANTGQTIWEHRYDWPYDPAGVYPGPRATPTIYDGRLYFVGPTGLVGCLDATRGTVIWTVDLAKTFQAKISGFGYACSPTVVDGQVLLPVGGPGASMVSLDAKTGATRWSSGDDEISYAPALPVTLHGRAVVLGYLQNAIVCHDRMTGELLWRHVLSSGYDEHSSWPLYREPLLWVSAPFRSGGELLELTTDPAQPVRSRGKQNLISNDIFSSVLFDNAIFGFDVKDPQAKTHRSTRGFFRCLDFESGEELWSVGDDRPMRSRTTPLSTGDRIGHATVIVADGKLILFNDLGELILAKASREQYTELARTSVLGGEICWTQPALSRGRLFVRNQSRAACVFLGDPNRLSAELKARSMTTADIPQQDYVDWAAVILSVEPEYAFDLPSMEWFWLWFQVMVAMLGLMLLTGSLAAWLPVVWKWPPERRAIVYWLSVLFCGAVGTTLLSARMNEFVFTWPLCLFAAYQMFIDRVELKRQKLSLRERLVKSTAAIFFVSVCVLYFLVCRRLSLVFEWTFLMGFAAAIPFSLAGRLRHQHPVFAWIWKVLSVGLAFSAYYWSSVAFIHWRVLL